MAGPDLEGQVQVLKKCPGPGPDRTSDSLELVPIVILVLGVVFMGRPWSRPPPVVPVAVAGAVVIDGYKSDCGVGGRPLLICRGVENIDGRFEIWGRKCCGVGGGPISV